MKKGPSRFLAGNQSPLSCQPPLAASPQPVESSSSEHGVERCGCGHGAYDTREHTWRHLDIWQCKTFIYCRLPRLDCPGGPVTAEVPWAPADSKHFTALFEAQALQAVCECETRGLDENFHCNRTGLIIIGTCPDNIPLSGHHRTTIEGRL